MKMLMVLLMSIPLLACGEKSVMDDVGDAVDSAATETADAIDEATDEVEAAVND